MSRQFTTQTNGRPLKIGYIMSRFPKLTETFILFEMLAVEACGAEVEVYPLLREKNKRIHQEGASLVGKIAELAIPTRDAPVMHPEAVAFVERAHFQPFLSWPILQSQFRALFRQPGTYLSTLWTLVRANWGSANFLLGALAFFPKAVHWARQMEEQGIDHVHAHFANHPAAVGFVIHRMAGIPYSFAAHGADLQVDQHMLCEKVAEAAFVITDSFYNKNTYFDTCDNGSSGKVHVLRCGVDLSFFKPCPPETKRAGDQLEILCVGTFYEVKGHRYLIEACRLLLERGVPFRCRLVGEGPDREMLVALVRDCGLEEHVHFLGTWPRDEIAGLMRDVDVLVTPSVPTPEGRREGIPVVLMEGMASGLPVVTSRISGIPELVEHEISGLLVEPRDVAGLADSLERLWHDPALRQRLGQAGRRKVDADFNQHRNAQRLVDYIAQHAGKP